MLKEAAEMRIKRRQDREKQNQDRMKEMDVVQKKIIALRAQLE